MFQNCLEIGFLSDGSRNGYEENGAGNFLQLALVMLHIYEETIYIDI